MAQLAAVGVDRHAIRRRILQGRAERATAVVISFAQAADALDRSQRELAALLQAGESAVLWGTTAAARLGMWDRPERKVHVASSRQVTAWTAFPVAFHRSERARRHDDSTRCDCPSPYETLRSCARSTTALQLASMLRQGTYTGCVTLAGVERYLGSVGALPGTGVLRDALALRRAGSAGSRCWTEDVFAQRWAELDVRVPLVNVRGATELTDYEPDFAWVRERVILEIDGDQHEADPVVREQDRVRDETLAMLGWCVLREHWRAVRRDPERVARSVQDALSRRQ